MEHCVSALNPQWPLPRTTTESQRKTGLDKGLSGGKIESQGTSHSIANGAAEGDSAA